MASKLLSTDQENFIHLGQVCIDLLKIILKDILKIHIESKKLYAAISSCPTLTTGKYQIRSDQKKICFIPPPSVPDYEKFDVSLLYALIRNLCPSLKPTQGWGKDPTSTDIQIGDDIERLRLFRNGMFAHLDSTAVPDTEFTTAWNNLKIIIPRTQAFVRSNGISADYERELENIERSDFGLSDMEKYKTLLEGILCILKRQENEEFPRIAINGEDKVVCGKMVLLEAKVQHPSKSLTCTIIWQRVRHNGTERIVTSEEKYKDSTSRELVIQKVSKEDEGEYQAVIPWVMDGQTHNITSNTIFLRPLGEKPTLEKLNVNTGTVGITLNYKYKVSQDSPEVDHIAWTRNGDALNIDQIKYVGGGLLDTYFSITSPTCEDRGTYTCIVGNAVGNIAESLLLDFPNATISTENFVVYGNETRIDSKLISCPPCERVVWQKSSDLLSTFNDIDVSSPKYYGTKLDPRNPILVLREADFEDRLFYRLLTRNKIGERLSNTVFIDVTGCRPNIISCSPVTNRTKKSVSLRCDVFPPENSPPLNEIVWMKNDKIIDIAQSGGKYIGGTIKDATLVINDVNEHDAGSFQCRASNALGSTLGKVIVLSVPEIQIQREERTETNTLHFTASIESFPAAFSVHWSKKNKDKDEYTPIDVNEEECRGTSNSLPHPLLVTTQRNLICKSFKIEARNFIGASTKYIPDDSSSPSCNMSDNKENRLNDIYKKKGSTIRFNNLHNVLIREIPEERLKSLKRSLKVVSSRDVSVENIATVEDFFTTLYDEGIFKEQDVIMMQYLLRNIERPDLELKCVEYARNNKQCYFEESKPAETGFKHVQLHVEKDFKNFTDMEMDNIVDTVAAIVGCDKSCIELVSVRPNRSFIIVLSMKAKFARILEQKGSFGLTRLLTYNVDWIKVGNNTINIARETHQKHALVDSTYMSKEETINACRACRLLLGPCTDQLRDVLRHHVPPQHIAREITNLPRLSAPQMNLILPSGSSYTGNYDDMDIPLLYILLRNICSIPPHSNGWGNDPDPTDRSLSANIERIRIARNQCVHSSTPALSNADFYTVWAIARSAVVDLDTFLSNGKKFEKEVDFLRYETIDPVRDYKEELRKQSEEDVKTWEITQGLKHEIKQLKSVIPPIVKDKKQLSSVIPPNIKDLHEKEIIRCEKEDKVYSESHSFLAMFDKVRKQPYMTFVGGPGSGKSATIHHIALILQKEGCEVVSIKDIRKIDVYSNSRHPQVFIIDDVVGVHGLQKQKLELLIDYEKRISDPSHRNTKVLMSCREVVFNECYKSFFLNEKNIILMQSSEYALNDEDKKSILQKHGLDRDLLSPTLLGEKVDMFPLLCYLYSKAKKSIKNVGRFFTCPVECILEEFDKMQQQKRLCYATLVLCMLNDSKISKAILKNTAEYVFYEMKSKVLESCKVGSYTEVFKFVGAISEMEGTYLKLCGTEYTFNHYSLFEILAYHFFSQFPCLCLKYMNSTYIAKCVKVHEYKKELGDVCKFSEKKVFSAEKHEGERSERCHDSSEPCIRLKEFQYPMLAERLYRDIENMELYDVFMNDILKQPKVCEAFIAMLKSKSYTELKSLFLTEQKDVSKVVSKGQRVAKGSEKREEWSKDWNRQRVLVNERGIMGKKYGVRVISWVVYYGHNQILKYILKQTDLHNETDIELFSTSFNPTLSYKTNERENNIETINATDELCLSNSVIKKRNQEQYNSMCVSESNRLFLLSCYGGDLETVRILIKYVDINAINRKQQYDETPLTAACECGHLNVVKELLEAGADTNPECRNNTPLTAACEGGQMSVVKKLIEAGADINPEDKDTTPLIAATRSGNIDVVKELLKAGADINPGDRDTTPLIAASRSGHIDVVKELLKAGADINSEDQDTTPLIAASRSGHIDVVRELLKAGADINSEDQDTSPLIAASRSGHIDVVKELLKAGADINSEDQDTTPLIAASRSGYIDVVRELLKAGADINPGDQDTSPLIAASRSGHIDVVKELLKAGADINPEDQDTTPLTAACEGGNMSVVKKLLEAGADINPQGWYNTPLTAACEGGHISLVRELLEAGADINPQGRNYTPLRAAVSGGYMNLAKWLLEAGADINLQGRDYTPLRAAVSGGYMNLAKELLEAGADINQQGRNYTLLRAAASGGYMNLVKGQLEAGADINQQGLDNTPLSEGEHMSVVKELQ